MATKMVGIGFLLEDLHVVEHPAPEMLSPGTPALLKCKQLWLRDQMFVKSELAIIQRHWALSAAPSCFSHYLRKVFENSCLKPASLEDEDALTHRPCPAICVPDLPLLAMLELLAVLRCDQQGTEVVRSHQK